MWDNVHNFMPQSCHCFAYYLFKQDGHYYQDGYMMPHWPIRARVDNGRYTVGFRNKFEDNWIL